MPKTIKIVPHLGSEELEGRYRKARDPVERSHYQILWLNSEGKTTGEVMEVTGYSRGSGSSNSLAVTTPMDQRRSESVVTETWAPGIGPCSPPSNSTSSPGR